MKYLEIIKLILSLFPLLIQTIKAIEDAIPGQGAGEQKLALVRGVLESAYKTATDVTGQFESVWPALSGTVNAIVSTFNAVGVFTKKAG